MSSKGSVRRSENRIRMTGQLVDASTGTHLWADRFEGTLDDIFELQDQIATSIVGAIASQLERAEIEHARRKPTGNLSAYDNYLRAMPHLHRGTREAINEAPPLFCKAMQLDPEFASAHAMAAWCHFRRKINGWMEWRCRICLRGALIWPHPRPSNLSGKRRPFWLSLPSSPQVTRSPAELSKRGLP
jgi:hypothetical protein